MAFRRSGRQDLNLRPPGPQPASNPSRLAGATGSADKVDPPAGSATLDHPGSAAPSSTTDCFKARAPLSQSLSQT